MYLRESRQKRADGSTLVHLQLAESVWNREKARSETRIVYNFGRADDAEVVERLRLLARSILRRCSPEELEAESVGVKVVDTWPFGDLHVLEALWERLGIKATIAKHLESRQLEFPVERALFAMVANRACAPASKLYCFQQWLREDVRIDGAQAIELHHLYRAMDFLEACKDEIEREIYFRVADLLSLDVDLIFYDTTSLHFEIDEEDEGEGADDTVQGSKAAGGKRYQAPRKLGYSKNGRSDAPQIVVGLAVTRDGLPIRHWIFPGNTVDVTTVEQVKNDLRGWQLGRCVFVGDAGMVSKENLRTLSLGGGRYIVNMPIRQGDDISEQVLGRAGRFRVVADNLRVKEVVLGEGERRRRYVVCHNPDEETRQRKHRERVLAELEAELVSLSSCDAHTHSKRECALRASRRYGKYLCTPKNGGLRIDRAKVAAAARLDGKFVVHSNDDTLSAEDLALGYKQLMRVEHAWRTLKTGLEMRPVHHHAVHRIHAHVAISVLALLLERVAERACHDTWRNIRDDLRQIKLVELIGPTGRIRQTTEPAPAASKRLKSLQIGNPPLVLSIT